MSTVYVYEAIRRTKENTSMEGPSTIREVLYSHQTEAQVINKLKNACRAFPGKWRIYRSVNKRDERKSKIELAKTLIDQLTIAEGVTDKNPESLWKTILMQPRNKAERLFLIDVDSKDSEVLNQVLAIVHGELINTISTPNGYHVICKPFNPVLIEGLTNVSIQKDALLYIESFET